MEFLPVDGGNLVAFRLKDRANGDTWDNIIVALNARSVPAKLAIPEGKYTVVCRDGVIDERGLGSLYGPRGDGSGTVCTDHSSVGSVAKKIITDYTDSHR